MSTKKTTASAMEQDAYQEEIRESIRWLKLAVTKIQQLAIAASPENYAIWYTYYSGGKPELKQALDRRLNNKQPFTPDVCRQFYSQYFVEGPEQQLAQVRKAIRAMISKLSTEIVELNSGLSDYNAFLTGCEGELGKDPEVRNLNVIIQDLLSQTKDCRSKSSKAMEKVSTLNKEVQALQKSMQDISEDVLEDPLTGLANRHALDLELSRCIEESVREETSLILLLLDLDKFSAINELHGHIVGDRVLRFVSQTIKKTVKGKDFVSRYGGEEFAVILPSTEATGGLAVAKNILHSVSSTKLTVSRGGESLESVTLSAGMCVHQKEETAAQLLERAEKLLIQAKHDGRNCIASDQG